MKRQLAYLGDPILRKKGLPVAVIDETIRNLVDDMIDTMNAHNGIGLAAPQVKESLQLFVTCVPIKDDGEHYEAGVVKVYINPKILSVSDELWTCQEGCLSIPKVYVEIARPLKVTVRAQNLDGEWFEETVTHLEAHAVLHENDHVNGVLFIDRIHGKKRKELEPLLRVVKAKYGPH